MGRVAQQPEHWAALLRAARAVRGADDLCELMLGALRRDLSLPEAALLGLQGGVFTRRSAPAGLILPAPLSAAEWQTFARGEVVRRPGGLLVPVQGRAFPRLAAWLPGQATLGGEALAHVEAVGALLGLELEQVELRGRLQSLLDLQRKLTSRPPDELYQPLLEEAVALVPGAEGGSLLLRREDRFYYAALVNHDWNELEDVSFSVEDTRDVWYGAGHAQWDEGIPRVMTQAAAPVHRTDYLMGGLTYTSLLPSMDHIRATITVPILYGGDVYALMNLDSFSSEFAFAADSVEAMQSFCVQAAVLMHGSRQRELVERSARTDVLTGLYNRRHFNDVLAQHLAAAERHGQPLALLIADLTNFKAINDTLGHAAGDAALVAVADILRRSVRASDTVFRWGGDEFAVILPQTDGAGAAQMAARFVQELGRAPIQGVTVGASIGVGWGQGRLNAEALLHEADQAMYAAKARGAASRASGGDRG
ncbi:GGDEF domain-containing protein [Deinococcus aquaedulcis]|uniref:GGDEF domain-containing protein n=1 Tax=Deinococcus aquaedulcis TaxID=2840455 RepID=UPI001C8349A7|nr:sensor domain-containing diguanylate cyclase [Deinococcus aquaedulcis]